MDLSTVCILAVLAFASPTNEVSLTCHTGLDQVCPDDNLQRMCTCTSTGTALRWRINQSGTFDETSVMFLSTFPVGTAFTRMGFLVNLTTNANGILTSIMTFTLTPTAVPSSGISVTCDDSNPVSATSCFAVTPAASDQAPVPAHDQQYNPVSMSSTSGDIAMTRNAAYGLMTDKSRPQYGVEIKTQVNVAYGHMIPTHQAPLPAEYHQNDPVPMSSTSGDIAMTSNAAYGLIAAC